MSPAATSAPDLARAPASALPRGVTVRSVALGLLLVVPNAAWVATVEVVRTTEAFTELSLFGNVVFTLLVVTALNSALRRLCPRLALSAAEMVVVYILTTLGTAMAGLDMVCCLPAIMAYPAHFATPDNGWERLFIPLLPKGLVIGDRAVASGLWLGGGSFVEPAVFNAWLPALGRWGVFCLGMCGLWVGLTTLFSPRWIESERLTYPISLLPTEMCLHPRRLARSRTVVITALAVAAINLLNGLHQLRPQWPQIPLKPFANPGYNIGAQLAEPPWNAIDALFLSFFPFGIGLGLLLPTRLSCSCWVFYLGFKALHVLVNRAGSWTMEGFPYTREQSLGAFLALVAFSAYMSRHHLRRAAREAVRGAPRGSRPLTPRMSFVVLLGSVIFLVAFSTANGMTPAYAMAFFGLYACLCMSFTRVRAEMGIPTHELHLVGPGQCLFRWLGSETIGRRNLATATVYYWFNRAYRGHPMPHIAEGFKMCERSGTSQAALVPLMAAAAMLGGAVSVLTILHTFYRDGANAKWAAIAHSQWIASVPYGELASVLESPTKASAGMVFATLVGFLGTLAGMSAHTYVSWWPLHPVGYAVSNGHSMNKIWFSIFIAWCIKAAMTRYGGSRGVQQLTSLAYGLVLGDYGSGSLWSLYGTWKTVRAYSSWI